jgi:glutamyl-tRNA synthetase
MEEMVAAFTIERVNPNPARFDLKKAEAINATHLRALDVADLTARIVPYLQRAGLLGAEPTDRESALLQASAPLVHERMTVLGEAVDLLGFLFVDDEQFERDPGDAAKFLDDFGRTVVKAAHDALAELDTWDAASIDAALRRALVDDLGLKPRSAFGPVRVAVTGRRISPPLFESLELLGRDRALARLVGPQVD